MKKIKFLLPLAATLGTIGSISPLFVLTSCGKNSNLMKEYTPTIKQHDRQSFNGSDDAVGEYLNVVSKNHEIFEQDLRYTISRGLPQYISYISEYCEIKDNNFSMDVDLDSVKVVNNDTERTITFDATFTVLYDYSGTKYHEMKWYDMTAYRWDTKTKARFVLDFDTRGFENYPKSGNPSNAYRKKMTTLAGATQFGVSEINSTVQLLSETGYCIDLDGNKKTINTTVPDQKPCHFMLPEEYYWASEPSRFQKIYSEVYDLWFNHPSLQVIVLLFKYYMPNNTYSAPGVPNTFDFGSYHMANISLKETYTLKSVSNAITLYGFNSSLDCQNNFENLKTSGNYVEKDHTFNIPGELNGLPVKTIESNAFNSGISNYSNFGIPEEVETAVIPKQVTHIGEYAFASNPYLKGIKFEKPTTTPTVVKNSFYLLSGLTKIDFSSYTSIPSAAFADGCFKNIHLGVIVPEGTQEGEVIVPASVGTINEWKLFLANCGLDIYDKASGQSGWYVHAL